MLSYQHAYHAGNLADVHKHAALAWALNYLIQKDKPLSYLETHSGRGLYDLAGVEAAKTGEAAKGVAALADRLDRDHPYIRVLADIRAQHGDTAYPGSPLIAQTILRPDDKIHLAEKHPQEFAALKNLLPHQDVRQMDGPEMVLSLTPPTPRRGICLIDPSYEVKAEFDQFAPLIAKLHRKWNVGIIVLWYPILTTGAHRPLTQALDNLNIPDAQRFEVRFPAARDGHRMIGSGLYVVNPPFGMDAEMRRIAAIFG